MKKIISAVTGLLFATTVLGQANDPVLMKINGKAITRSEFEYSFNKNNTDGVIDKKDVESYVPLFVDFKLKVEAAKDACIDTLPAIKKELRGYKEQMLLPTLVDNDFIEREARKTYDNTAARFAGQDLLKASHILVLLPQQATAEQGRIAKARIDSIYTVLKNGADFAEIAKKHSDDKGSAARGGALGEFGKGMMIPDFEKAAYALKKGEMSAPVKSTVGYHIILLEDRHPFEPYEFHHDNIIKFLHSRGIKEASANMLIDSISRTKGITRDEVIDLLNEEMLSKDSEMKNLAQEYFDGTMMYEICKTEIWDKAAKDEDGLAAYFDANKKKYVWDEPRFKGIVVHVKTEDLLGKAKKLIKGVDEEDWATTIVKELNNDSIKVVRIERGIYKKGDNANVDYFAFKKGEQKPMKDYPYATTFGKVMKKPKSYTDVRGLVTTDYQNELEKQWVEKLRNKYTVEIDKAVLSTVNNH